MNNRSVSSVRVFGSAESLAVGSWALTRAAAPLGTGLVFVFAASCLGNIYPIVVAPVGLLGLVFVARKLSGARLHPLGRLLLYIISYSLASAWLSGIRVTAFLEYDFWRNDGKFLFAYVPFLAALILRHSERHLRLAATIWVVGAGVPVVLAASSLLLPWLDLPALGDYPLIRLTSAGIPVFHGLFIAHTAAGGFYALALIFAIHLAQVSKRRWLYEIAAVIIAGGLVLSLSRAFAVATACALLIEALIEHRGKLLLGIAVIGGLLLLAIGGMLLDRLLLSREDPSAAYNMQVRVLLWERAIQYFATSPILGIGFSRYDDYPDEFSGMPGFIAWKNVRGPLQTVDGNAEWSMQAHNNFLQILAEQGLVGLALWLAFWGGLLRLLYRRYRASATRCFGRAWVSSCLGCSVVVLLASMFDLNFWAPSVMLPLGWAIGAAISPYGWIGEQKVRRSKNWSEGRFDLIQRRADAQLPRNADPGPEAGGDPR